MSEAAGMDDLVGSWIVEGQVEDGPAFVNISTFAPGGAAINTAGPGDTAHGAWETTTDGGYAFTFVSLEWDDDGDPRGRGTIRGTLAAGPDRDSFVGPFVTESTDPTGKVVQTYRGRVLLSRVTVEPMPPLSSP